MKFVHLRVTWPLHLILLDSSFLLQRFVMGAMIFDFWAILEDGCHGHLRGGLRVWLCFTYCFCDTWVGGEFCVLTRWAILAIDFSGFKTFGSGAEFRFSHVGIIFVTG